MDVNDIQGRIAALGHHIEKVSLSVGRDLTGAENAFLAAATVRNDRLASIRERQVALDAERDAVLRDYDKEASEALAVVMAVRMAMAPAGVAAGGEALSAPSQPRARRNMVALVGKEDDGA